MRFGVRECCDVVLKAKANQKVGNKIFYKDEPVIYFDTLKTSTLEGAATTVYAQGGKGNARLMAWDGERTVTFTMEDALISPEGFMILSGAGLVEATSAKTIKQHITTRTTIDNASEGTVTIKLPEIPYFGVDNDGHAISVTNTSYDLKNNAAENYCYILMLDGDEVCSEPFIPDSVVKNSDDDGCTLTLRKTDDVYANITEEGTTYTNPFKSTGFKANDAVLVDYYLERTSGAQQINITPDKFGGNYYLEASTLFRDTNGVDMPAEFIIPNCKIQSNFSFTLSGSGDPSTFSFTMDAFPDYTRFDKTEKVLAALQIISETSATDTATRKNTKTDAKWDDNGNKIAKEETARTSVPATSTDSSGTSKQSTYSSKTVVS